CVRIQSDFDVW
nr:immunoglobulin heavy chain junction region [Macaca mulatta]